MRLDPACVLFPRDDVVHIVCRRGTFTVRGRGLGRVHSVLLPRLGAYATVDRLASELPTRNAGSIRAYLRELQQLGVLLEDRSAADTRSFRDSRPIAPSRVVCREEAASILLAPDRSLPTKGHMLVVLGQEAQRGDTHDGVSIEDWLCLIADEQPAEPATLRCYQDDGQGAMSCLAQVRFDEPCAIPKQLRLVAFADVGQLPLVEGVARHPLFDESVSGIGLTYAAVNRDLTMRFIALNTLVDRLERCHRYHVLTLSAPYHRRWEHRVIEPDGLFICDSLVELILCSLEHVNATAATGQADEESAEIDALASSDDLPQLEYLRHILRLKYRRLFVRCVAGSLGLFICTCVGQRAQSFLKPKALVDVLMAVAHQTFQHTGSYELPHIVRSRYRDFLGPHALRAMVRRQIESVGQDHELCVRTIRRWGMRVWAGYVQVVTR